MNKKQEKELEIFLKNPVYKLMSYRTGIVPDFQATPQAIKGIKDMSNFLQYHGGYHQQERMIRDKRKSLDRALLYSYQAALVRKLDAEESVRALINPNKLKPDYDEKIISIGWEHKFQSGDIFEWVNTNTYWIVLLHDLTELAYFRGEIRKCPYEITWLDEAGNKKSTFAAIRGPVETKINSIQKHQIRVDEPNYTLNMYIPKNEDNLKKFVRYSKFYLQDNDVCWKTTTVDSISTPGIIELTAIEDYSNIFEDDVENAIVDGLKTIPIDPNPTELLIEGETFIKVKKEYTYFYRGNIAGTWLVDNNIPVVLEPYITEEGFRAVKLKWTSSYSGQFDLYYSGGSLKKTIVVESLF